MSSSPDKSANDVYNLWTGESAWCKCGHHAEFHKSAERIMSLFGDNVPYGYCCLTEKGKGKSEHDEDIDIECNCEEFILL